MQWSVFRPVWLLPFVIFLIAVLSPNAPADTIRFRSELEHINSDSEITDKTTGAVSNSEFSALNQQYNLDFSKTIYPYLTLSGGTLYEKDKSTSTFEGIETEMEENLLRPFVELNLDNPFYKAGIEYRRDQLETKITGLPDTEDFRDEVNAILGWKPMDLPEFNLRYNYIHFYDNLETVDSLENEFTIDTNYSVWNKLQFNYFYRRLENENKLTGTETLSQNHNGRVDYSDNFINNRLTLATSYRVFYNTFEFPIGEGAEFPLLRSAGLLSLDNTPDDGPALGINSALIDGNLTDSSGINIGLAGDESTLTNIGIDFGFPVDVDRIRVWVDRRLSSSVADSFSWSVYTSPDNTDDSTWTLQSIVSPASFGIFENRFELSFPEVTTRFIKIVVRPLSPTISDAALFPNIFVTEMEAFSTLSAGSAENKTSIIDHNYNLNLIGRLSDKTVLGYNLFYRQQEQDPSSEKRTELTNGVYAHHTFNRIFSGSTNLSYTDTNINEEKSTTNTYAASITAAYLESFGQIFSFSGTRTTEEEGSSSVNSLFLRTNAKLYKGWSAFLDLGYSWDSPLDSADATSTILRSGTNLVPNEKININVNYSVTKTRQSGEEDTQGDRSEWDFQAFLTPFRALSLSARYNILERQGDKTSFQNYSANWSPFPDGDLQFFFRYDETLRPEEDRKDRSIGPGLKWTLGRHVFLDMSYSVTKSETILQTIDSKNLNATLRFIF